MGRILAGERLYVHCWGGHGRTGTLVALLLSQLYSLTADEALRYTQAFHDARRFPQGVRSPQTAVQRAQVKRVINASRANPGAVVGQVAAPPPVNTPGGVASVVVGDQRHDTSSSSLSRSASPPPAPCTPFRPASAAPSSARAWAAATRRPSSEVRLASSHAPAEAACYSPTTSRYGEGHWCVYLQRRLCGAPMQLHPIVCKRARQCWFFTTPPCQACVAALPALPHARLGRCSAVGRPPSLTACLVDVCAMMCYTRRCIAHTATAMVAATRSLLVTLTTCILCRE